MSRRDRLPKLLIMDLDGTTLEANGRPYARFSDEMSGFLDRLAASDCGWATNTTWEAKQQLQLFYASAAVSRPSFIIGGTGAQLCTLKDDELVKIEPYSGELERLLAEAHALHTLPLLQDVCSKFIGSNLFFNGYWFGMTAIETEADRMFRYLEDHYRSNRELKLVIIPEETRFYVHPALLSKGTPVREIMRITGLEPEDIVVAGDELMDLDMMNTELTVNAICPSNAHPDVKKRVLEMGGVVGSGNYGVGVMEAFWRLAEIRGWK